MFNTIDHLQRESFKDYRLPNGDVLDTTNRTLASAPLTGDPDNDLMLGGRLDCLIIHPTDGLVSVMDFKTAEPTEQSIAKYSRQLHAYAWMLEHPAKGDIKRVSGLQLFYAPVQKFTHTLGAGDEFTLSGYIALCPLPYEVEWFDGFLHGVLDMLKAPEPAAGEKCEYCNWEREIAESLKGQQQ
jgi:hypothetical protein